jgi:hypothetical protein
MSMIRGITDRRRSPPLRRSYYYGHKCHSDTTSTGLDPGAVVTKRGTKTLGAEKTKRRLDNVKAPANDTQDDRVEISAI